MALTYKELYEQMERKQDKINFLKGLLTSTESPVGDWKVIKIYEARLKGEADPYDLDALVANRQQVRDKINEVQAEEDETAAE